MAEDSADERHSEAQPADIIKDEDEKARREARNALQQFDTVTKLIEEWCRPDRSFKLRSSTILQLHRQALDGISAYAGNWRPAAVQIHGSKHRPVGAHLVPEKIEEMCDYVNDNWNRSAVHLASYTLWRLNWIHPFVDGNGRTARALSYLILCIRLGYQLPGTNTIPDQISNNKDPYYHALEAADDAYEDQNIDMTEMEKLVEEKLAGQLAGILKDAIGESRS